MATEVVMPKMGYDMKEGKIIKWLVNEGQEIKRGDILAEIETDKATIEMEAFASGQIRKIVVLEGETVPVGTVLGFIGSADEPLPDVPSRNAAPPPVTIAGRPAQARGQPPSTPQSREAIAAPSSEARATPLARRIAEEHNVDLAQVTGTGPGGRVTERDVQAALAARQAGAPAPAAQGLQELSRMRQAIARLTTRSKQEIPHYYVTAEMDMDEAVEFRRKLNQALQSQNIRVGVNDMLVKACALALAKHPTFNASYIDGKVLQHSQVNIGIAVALEGGGLVVPAILDAGHKSLVEIAKAAKDLVERAQALRLREQEYTGATFTISNLGAQDIDSFVAIIHPPQCAVLALGAIHKHAVVKNDQVVVGQTMKATLSCDHRLTDGLQAAKFLVDVKALMEQPRELLP